MVRPRLLDLFAGRSETPDGCWVGVGHANGNGYRWLRINGRKTYVHRLAYETFVGPIPAGLHIDHLCRVRECCNPAHLEAVTNAENILRGDSAPARNARKTSCPKGHAYTEQPDGTRRCMSCRRARRVDSGEINGRGLPADRTHCPAGHAYDEENTYVVRRRDGSVKQRMCRECGRARVRARRALARQESAA